MAKSPPLGIRYPWEVPPAHGEVIQVADGVLWTRLPLPMKLDHVNIYILDDGDGWTVIDTGFGSNKTKELWEGLLGGPLSGKPVARVLVTHHHPDHIGLAGWFQTEHGAELLTTRTAWLMGRMLTLDVQETSTPETIAFYRSAGMPAGKLEARASERPFNFGDIVAPLPVGYTRIKQGDRLQMAGRNWRVEIGNGHAPEHATLWSEDDDLILGGDQLLPSISPNLGVYATEPMADPVSDWIAACMRFQPMAREEHLVLGGHKLPFRGLPTRLRQLIDNHHGALDRLRGFVADGAKTAVECFPPIFKRPIGDGEFGLAMVEAVAHMNHLYLAGEVTREMDDSGAWRYRLKSVSE